MSAEVSQPISQQALRFLHHLGPQPADVVAGLARQIARGLLFTELAVSGPVALGLHGELERFQAVVLGEVGHEGA